MKIHLGKVHCIQTRFHSFQHYKEHDGTENDTEKKKKKKKHVQHGYHTKIF